MDIDPAEFATTVQRIKSDITDATNQICRSPTKENVQVKTNLLVRLALYCNSYDDGATFLNHVNKWIREHLSKYPDTNVVAAFAAANHPECLEDYEPNQNSSSRKMNTPPATLDQVVDKLVRSKYDQIQTRFDHAGRMTTPNNPRRKNDPRVQSYLVTISEVKPNKGGGDRSTERPNEKRQPPRVCVRAYDVGTDTVSMVDDGTLYYALGGLRSILPKETPRATRKVSKAALKKDYMYQIPNTDKTMTISFAFTGDEHSHKIFGAKSDDNSNGDNSTGKRKATSQGMQSSKRSNTRDDDDDDGESPSPSEAFHAELNDYTNKNGLNSSDGASAAGAAPVPPPAPVPSPAATAAAAVAAAAAAFGYAGSPMGYSGNGLVTPPAGYSIPPRNANGKLRGPCPQGPRCPDPRNCNFESHF